MELNKLYENITELQTILIPAVASGVVQGFGLGALMFASNWGLKIGFLAFGLFIGYLNMKKAITNLIEYKTLTDEALDMKSFNPE